MVDIVACLQCTLPHITLTTMYRLSRIILALLAMTGRVTMLGLSRWAGPGGTFPGQYLRHLSGVDSMVHPSQRSHLSHHLVNKNRIGQFQYRR